MRPLKLTMMAFGPYKHREIIDFALLKDRRLFVISGSTGAGKTTIFDAICFALYGTASGEDRYDARMLRSHFADEDTHTSVELEFSVGRRVFRVLRQLGHRKGANKTETGGKVELYERIDGQDVPSIDRYTVKDVNDRLEQIIGLTNDQFSQIVMLPQGEFRKLLTSETENKEEILRRIFRTELYQKVEGRFQHMTKELRTALQATQTELEVYMKQISATLPIRDDSALARTLAQEHQNVPQILDGLEQETVYYTEQLTQSQQKRTELQGELASKQTQRHEAMTLNERFQQLADKSKDKAAMDNRLPEHADKESRLERAEKAARLEPYEEQWLQASKTEELKRKEHDQKESDLAIAAQEWQAAERRYQEEAAFEDQRHGADRELQRLQELQPAVEALHAHQQQVATLLREEQQSADKLAAHERQLLSLRAEKQKQSERIQALEKETAALPAYKEGLGRLREQAKLMKETIEIERLIASFIEKEAESQQAFRHIQTQHDVLEQSWIEGQSSLLAAHLHDGQPCPVCGSAEHPSKAEAAETMPTKEQLQEAKQLLRHIEREYNQVKAELAATNTGLVDKQTALSEFGISMTELRSQYDQLVHEGLQAKEAVERLESQLQVLQQVKLEAVEREAQLDKLALDKESLSARFQDIRVERSAKQSLLEKELERIPEELRTPERLFESCRLQQAVIQKLRQAWQAAQEQFQRLQTKLAEEKTSLSHIKRQLEEAEAARKQADVRFEQELGKAGCDSYAAYAQTKLAESQRLVLRGEIEAYNKAISSLAEQIAVLEQALAGKERADLDLLTNELARIEQELEQSMHVYQTYKYRQQDTERLSTNIALVSGRLKAQEEDWQQLKDVYDVLRGDNPQKLSFERYVLIEFLERILHAANERLRVLSNGQFVLQRSDRLEKHNRQSGLGLDVYDVYTGLNRDVKSMSGGEKFNASLCLALGMTDVIQAHQGGISIEMMFIDEGFGSLDEEALNKAIETLIDLQQSGRMIGVISHVQELKAAFPAILEVRKTKEGHSTTTIQLK
jgi:exonuclease SbcC